VAYVIEQVRKEVAAQVSDRNANAEADHNLRQGGAKHHPDDVASICAERHPNPDLAGAAGDVVGGYSVETDGGK